MIEESIEAQATPDRAPLHDATPPRSASASIDVRPATAKDPDAALRADVAALEAHLVAMGADRRPVAPVLRAYAIGLALAAAGLYAFVRADLPVAARVAGILVSTAGCVAMATIGHTASHDGFAESSLGNRVLYLATYPFLLMVSARYWRHSHVHVHHAAPNVVGVDYDCDLRPFFGLNEQHLPRASRARRLAQGLLLPIALPLNGFNIQRQGWARLIAELRDPRRRKPEAYADLAAMIAHVLVFLALPMAFAPPLAVVGVYALRVSLIGVALFAVLAPGHYPAEAACLDRSERQRGHFWLRQTATSVNFRTGPVGRFLCSGLEFQIEHHLLPKVSHVHLPAVSEAVRAICLRHGLPHRTLGWGEAVWASYRVFFAPKPVVSDVASLRLTPTNETS